MAYGMDGHIGISIQASMGTANTTSVDYAAMISESITETIEWIADERLQGRYDESLSREGGHTIEGDVVVEMQPILFGKLAKMWGGVSSGTLVGSVWTHVVKPTATDWGALSAVPPVTLHVYRGVDSSFQYSDMAFNQLTVEIENGQIVKNTASFVGGNFAFINKSTPSYAAGSVYAWDVVSLSIGGAAPVNIPNVTITMNNNVTAKPVLDGTKTPGRNKRDGMRSYEISGTAYFDNDDEYTNWRNHTSQRFFVHMKGSTISTSQSNAITIDIPSMVWDAYPVNMGGPGEIEVSFTGKGYYSPTSACAITITTVNTKAGY